MAGVEGPWPLSCRPWVSPSSAHLRPRPMAPAPGVTLRLALMFSCGISESSPPDKPSPSQHTLFKGHALA